MKKLGILYHPMVEATLVKARELEAFLTQKGVSVWVCSAWDSDLAKNLLEGTDLVLTVGGDGTILRAAQVLINSDIPVAGINLGKLGFMTEINAGEALAKLPALLDNKGWTDERAMLQVTCTAAGHKPRLFHALNDIVVARGEIARAIRIEASIDNGVMTTYKADGVIVATATGSTGYALAVGGPVIYPRSRDFLMVPVAPHLCPVYPVVLPESAEVRLSLLAAHRATLSVDGHINLSLSAGDVVAVKHSPHRIRFLRMGEKTSFFSNLEEKLRGRPNESDRKS